MNLKPLGDRVILRQDEAETTTAGGLILTHDAKREAAKRRRSRGGRGQLDKDGNLVPVPVKVGDKGDLRQVRRNRDHRRRRGRAHPSCRGHLRGLRVITRGRDRRTRRDVRRESPPRLEAPAGRITIQDRQASERNRYYG